MSVNMQRQRNRRTSFSAYPVQALPVLTVGLLAACSPNPAREGMPATPASAATSSASVVMARRPDTAAAILDSLSPAYKQFAKFLDLAVATRVPKMGWVDSVYTSGTLLGIDEQDQDMRWLAAFRILSVRTAGDSGRATAVITTVARQTPESEEGHYAVRYDIQEDTARWLLVRSDETVGLWMVDGDGAMLSNPRDRFTVLPIGRDLHWVTGSRDQAIAAVDSIRRARGLELVR